MAKSPRKTAAAGVTMRAKMSVRNIVVSDDKTSAQVGLGAVTGIEPYGPNGESEDNSFARYTPSASLTMVVNNPELADKFRIGQTFYVDFTEADVGA